MRLIVIYGVCGSGKTAVGSELARRIGAEFVDADDYHGDENRAKMGRGEPLMDEDRRPWLERLHNLIVESDADLVLACSALKREYRNILVNGPRENRSILNAESQVPVSDWPSHRQKRREVFFVLLSGPESLIRSRLETRAGHFMSAGMLTSQLNTLEPFSEEEGLEVGGKAFEVEVGKSVEEVVRDVESRLKNA